MDTPTRTTVLTRIPPSFFNSREVGDFASHRRRCPRPLAYCTISKMSRAFPPTVVLYHIKNVKAIGIVALPPSSYLSKCRLSSPTAKKLKPATLAHSPEPRGYAISSYHLHTSTQALPFTPCAHYARSATGSSTSERPPSPWTLGYLPVKSPASRVGILLKGTYEVYDFTLTLSLRPLPTPLRLLRPSLNG